MGDNTVRPEAEALERVAGEMSQPFLDFAGGVDVASEATADFDEDDVVVNEVHC